MKFQLRNAAIVNWNSFERSLLVPILESSKKFSTSKERHNLSKLRILITLELTLIYGHYLLPTILHSQNLAKKCDLETMLITSI